MFFVARNGEPTYTDRLKVGDVEISPRPSLDHKLNPETLEWYLADTLLSDALKDVLFAAMIQHEALLTPVEKADMIALQEDLERVALTFMALTPDNVAGAQQQFAVAAGAKIEAWPPLPTELETVRTQMISMCEAVINGN